MVTPSPLVADFSTCAYCPRLCRHVCPVTVATAREAATPSAMMTAGMLFVEGHRDGAYAGEAASLCLGCGACTAHCKVHVPVADHLRPLRADRQITSATVSAASLVIEGAAATVCVWTDRDWSAAWARRTERDVARVQTVDELSYVAWRQGDPGVVQAVAQVFAGRSAVTASAAVAAVLIAAGVPVERLRPRAAVREFHCCHDDPSAGAGQLACCGRREGFAEREPEAAAAVARENVRRFAGRRVRCDDEGCAAWLRLHGADVVDPVQELLED